MNGQADLEELYQAAKERLDAIRDAWFEAEQPLIGEGSSGQPVEHPLVKLLRDSEGHVARLAEQAKTKHRGPDPRAVVRQRLSASPGVKVRVIGTAKKRKPAG
jgi:hypothetical protein